ncbi:hypothetical protein A3Q56_06956 [Intoshia linei]|uniref:Uncharacterized protein n=1 Tax=Intoshia linei TaxID=1819745 RepID=A0A177AVR8_9BILA|nr:hypothetical protein A3Q56_06956 [Intoshia linei]
MIVINIVAMAILIGLIVIASVKPDLFKEMMRSLYVINDEVKKQLNCAIEALCLQKILELMTNNVRFIVCYSVATSSMVNDVRKRMTDHQIFYLISRKVEEIESV